MTQAEVIPTESLTASEVLGANPQETKPLEEVIKPDEKFSSKFSLLAKRERTAVERERAAKLKEQELEDKYRNFSQRESKLEEFERLKQTNPLKALELLGLSYEDLTKIQLEDGNIPADLKIKKVEDKFDNFVKTQEAALQRQEEEAKRLHEKREQEATHAFKGEISSYLKSNAERYELIAFENQEDLIYEVIDEYYTRTMDEATGVGQVMTIAEAADKVEKSLEEKYNKARDLKKVQAFLKAQGAPPSPPTRMEQIAGQKSKTLTNNLSATPAQPRKSPVSDEERIARAIAYARGLRP